MLKKITYLSVGLVFCLSSASQAQMYERTAYNYFKGSLGFSGLEDYEDSTGRIEFEDSTTLPINLAYGVSFDHAALEVELGFSHHDYDYLSGSGAENAKGDLVATKLMFNGMYRTSGTRSNFYVGGGLGFITVGMDGLDYDYTGSSLSTQFIVGGELRRSEKVGLFLELKRAETVALDLESETSEIEFDFKETSLNLGLRLYF